MKTSHRKEEYRFAFKFYQELLNLYKSGKLSESGLSKREAEFIKSTNFSAKKYIRQVKLNSYKYTWEATRSNEKQQEQTTSNEKQRERKTAFVHW